LIGACGENTTAPTPIPEKPTITITSVEPAVGATVTSGRLFSISFTKQQARTTVVQVAIAFVRDDGAYSPPIACWREESTTIAPYSTSMHSAWGIVGDEWRGNILYEFAKGRRVNAVMLFRTGFDLPGVGCEPLSTQIDYARPPSPTEGAIFPANADQRVDVTLDWLIQP
jgi:hypothetical protein